MTRQPDPASVRAVGWACVLMLAGLAAVVGAGLATAYVMGWWGK